MSSVSSHQQEIFSTESEPELFPRTDVERNFDKHDMYSVLRAFPSHIREAVEIGKSCKIFTNASELTRLVFLGMGGSAIGGDVIRNYVAFLPATHKYSIAVSRTYEPIRGIDEKTGVIASSYSGTTEETLSAFEIVRTFTKNIMCVSTGGTLAESARQHQFPLVQIPGGLQPRCALGYSFFATFTALAENNFFGAQALTEYRKSLGATIDAAETHARDWSGEASGLEGNVAYELAEKLHGTIPVIYTSDALDSVGARWRGQIQENAKSLAFGSALPEMNHNEINGWSNPQALAGNCTIILLRDTQEHPRVALRFEAMKELLANNAKNIIEIRAVGSSALERMFYFLQLADWTSYWLAKFYNVDPTEIPLISGLKNRLSEA